MKLLRFLNKSAEVFNILGWKKCLEFKRRRWRGCQDFHCGSEISTPDGMSELLRQLQRKCEHAGQGKPELECTCCAQVCSQVHNCGAVVQVAGQQSRLGQFSGKFHHAGAPRASAAARTIHRDAAWTCLGHFYFSEITAEGRSHFGVYKSVS